MTGADFKVAATQQLTGNKVIIFMPVFNGQTFLVEAIESIVNQSYTNFELWIYDGGSADKTLEICNSFAISDARIHVVVRPNTTPIQRFNEALRVCASDFLFLVHADDVQHLSRIELQLKFLAEQPAVILLGTDTYFWLHDLRGDFHSGYSGIAEYPRTNAEIKAQLLFWWCFANPSLAFRVKHFQENSLFMSEEYKYCADYQFYWEVSQSGQVANLDRALVAYRHHSASEGPTNRPQLAVEMARVKSKLLELAGLKPELTEKLRSVYSRLIIERNVVVACPDSLSEYETLFEIIRRSSNNGQVYAQLSNVIDVYMKQIRNQKIPFKNSFFSRVLAKLKRMIKA